MGVWPHLQEPGAGRPWANHSDLASACTLVTWPLLWFHWAIDWGWAIKVMKKPVIYQQSQESDRVQSDKESTNADCVSHDETESLGAGGPCGEKWVVNPSNCWEGLTKYFSGEKSCSVCALNKIFTAVGRGQLLGVLNWTWRELEQNSSVLQWHCL